MTTIDHEYTREITCPYCGHVPMDSWEWDDNGEEECSKCGNTYTFERIVTIEYSTAKKEGASE